MLNNLEKLFSIMPRWLILLISLLLLCIIGAIDFLTGTEISFSVFYLLPVVLVSWYGERRSGYVICVLAAVTWFAIERISDQTYSQEWIAYWNAGVRLIFFLLTAYLLSEIKLHLDQEHKLSRSDRLTGTRNSRAFQDALRFIFKMAARHHHPTVLARIDLKNFKSATDTMGHAEGDRILQTLAMALKISVRSTDLIGRLGGNEFAVLLPQTDLDGAKNTFYKLHARLIHVIGDQGWPIGLSIGVITFPDNTPLFTDALRQLDILMQQIRNEDVDHVVYEVFHGE